MIDPKDWKWFGTIGHFICGQSCIFRMHTNVGKFKISTVGAMYEKGKLIDIGHNRTYETFVFELDDKGKVLSFVEIDAKGIYVEDKDKSPDDMNRIDRLAEKMHMDMCYRYAAM